MPAFICTACGTQYPPSERRRPQCTICEEERQFVPPAGQCWTTLEKLAVDHVNAFRQHEPGLIGIGTEPTFAIGQRALLVRTPHGNVLWDCISLIDDATVTLDQGARRPHARSRSRIRISTRRMVEWSRAFGDVPVHLHAADREWIMRPDPAHQLWDGDTLELLPDVTLIRCGGHFPGGAMLHWAKGAGGTGRAVLGRHRDRDDRPQIPHLHAQLSEPDPAARRARSKAIAAALAPFAFDTLYGHYFDRVIANAARRCWRPRSRAISRPSGTPRNPDWSL